MCDQLIDTHYDFPSVMDYVLELGSQTNSSFFLSGNKQMNNKKQTTPTNQQQQHNTKQKVKKPIQLSLVQDGYGTLCCISG